MRNHARLRLRFAGWSLLLVTALLPVVASSQLAPTAGPRRASISYYVPMRDGVRIALSLWFPGGSIPARPVPTLLIQTRYGRAGVFGRDDFHGYQPFVAAGFAVAIIDTRGSTSSFGSREADIGPDEVRDMDEVVAHIASRPWSNGAVYVTGLSYMADTADVATSRPAPAIKGGIIRETDFDVWAHLFFPGGVKNDWFLEGWGQATYRMDLGLSVDPGLGLDCRARASDCAKLWPMLQPVDDDPDYVELRKALEGRKRWTPDTYASTEYRDDVATNGYPLFASSPAAHLSGIRKHRIPVQYWGSWMDGGTAEAALARFRSAPEVPMEVWITANNHPQSVGADPFFPTDRSPRPTVESQQKIMEDFLVRLASGERIARRIHYYVLGTGRFDETTAWPPADTVDRRWWFASDGRMLDAPPVSADLVRYAVDFSASTGKTTRWSTQFLIDPDYRDRREEDRKLLTFDTAAFGSSMEIAGTPVLTLDIATRTADPAVHAYLEDVAPDGTVTYLTEGMFRLVNRRLANPATLPYDQGPAPHSFRRADAAAMVPGEYARVEFALFPVAALIAAGHRLRLAIAGTDTAAFHRYSQGGSEEFSVRIGGDDSSGMTLPMRPARVR